MENYLQMCRDILAHGHDERKNTAQGGEATTRTGVFTKSLFKYDLEFDLSDGKWPLLTNKKQPVKSTIAEFLWCINGERHLSGLINRGCTFWNKWPYKQLVEMIKAMNPKRMDETHEEHTEKLVKQIPTEEQFNAAMKLYAEGQEHTLPPHIVHLLRNVDDMGPLYGFQWRHWSKFDFATTFGYGDTKVDAFQQHPTGIDQLAEVVDKIRNKPNDRRMIVSSWNVSDLPEMVLPPCHACHINHYVRGEYLDVSMVQRSCDVALGVPVNIAFYALYTMVIAKITGKKPGKLHWCGENVHIYEDQIAGVKEMLRRSSKELPTIKLPDIKELEDLRTLKVDDFVVEGYNPHPAINMPVAV